jgi:hypothetical protein
VILHHFFTLNPIAYVAALRAQIALDALSSSRTLSFFRLQPGSRPAGGLGCSLGGSDNARLDIKRPATLQIQKTQSSWNAANVVLNRVRFHFPFAFSPSSTSRRMTVYSHLLPLWREESSSFGSGGN